MRPVIEAQAISKKYLISHQSQPQYSTLRDSLSHGLQNLITPRKNQTGQSKQEEFWALQNVSFKINQGDRVGVIGRNGAGKSTLLKLLSRITEPSSGKINLRGRVASLLEVGTGFHPELTGRENIFLNGAILGMSKAEISRKFDEIVAFAEVEKFLDTPVKRYSSGMYVRLAFAVAAHLEPEILIVDEVLAVGDAQFQKKCLGKMEDAGKDGRTVLFVSHNMAAITQLCTECIYLKDGRLELFAKTEETVRRYMSLGSESAASVRLESYLPRQGNGRAKFQHAAFNAKNGEECREYSIGESIRLSFSITPVETEKLHDVKLAVELKSSDGVRISNMIDTDSGFSLSAKTGRQTLTVTIPDIRLYPDTYSISLWAGNGNSSDTYDYVEDCLSFRINDGGLLTTRNLPRSAGILFLTPHWTQHA